MDIRPIHYSWGYCMAKVQLIDNWKSAWRFASIWMMAAMAIMPELYNLAISMGVLSEDTSPGALVRLMQIMSFLGIAIRMIKQKMPEIESEQKESA